MGRGLLFRLKVFILFENVDIYGVGYYNLFVYLIFLNVGVGFREIILGFDIIGK